MKCANFTHIWCSGNLEIGHVGLLVKLIVVELTVARGFVWVFFRIGFV